MSYMTTYSQKRRSSEPALSPFPRRKDPDTRAGLSHVGRGNRGLDAYDARRHNGAPRYRCKACKADFSITSGTLFASHKLSLRLYLAAIAAFCNEVKGKSMIALSRELGLSYKAAFVLCDVLPILPSFIRRVCSGLRCSPFLVHRWVEFSPCFTMADRMRHRD